MPTLQKNCVEYVQTNIIFVEMCEICAEGNVG
jgi:hypothetical protein